MHNYNYVDIEKVNPNLICCICRTPFFNPIITATCSHTFCRDCIVRSLDTASCCPVDRSPLNIDDLRPESLLLRNMVDELIVECEHRIKGCTYTCQRQLLANHVEEKCLYTLVPCSGEGCSELVSRKDCAKHTHDCTHRVQECLSCGTAVKVTDMENHHLNCVAQDITCEYCDCVFPRSELEIHNGVCAEHPSLCTHSSNGCSWKGRRKDLLATHILTCPYEAIKGYFAVNGKRMENVENENMILKQKVHELELRLCGIQKELNQCKRSLGPWFRQETLDMSPAEASSHILRNNDNGARSHPGRPHRTSTYGVPLSIEEVVVSSSVSPPLIDPAYLAPYFPPQEDIETTNVLQTSEINLSAPRHPGYPQQLYGNVMTPRVGDLPTTSSPPQIVIPPLETDVSLERALSSLRSSMVALCSSVDILNRRQDLALTTENLRMTEEVSALRAVVHGLRMQVHSIMLERHNQIARSTADGAIDWASGPHFYGHPSSITQSLSTPPIISSTKL